jgi:hypothetical protein
MRRQALLHNARHPARERGAWHFSCKTPAREDGVKSVRLSVAILLTLFTVVLLRPDRFSSDDEIAWPAPAEVTPTSAIIPLESHTPEPETGAVDLYGNEVNDAVATYKLDPTGLMYEEHSPHTELPKLGTPKT